MLMNDPYLYAIRAYVSLGERYIIYVNERPWKTCLFSVVFERQYVMMPKELCVSKF